MPQLFGTDRVLLYDVDPWNRLGFGVPNFGSKSRMGDGFIDTIGTLNVSLHSLADEIARLQLFLMTHEDAWRTQPPSRNTIERIGKMLNRVNSVLGARMSAYNELRLEPNHQRPAVKIWMIHPVPYFDGPFVRNHWMMEYNELVMYALTNFYQHSDNNLSLTTTTAFATEIYQYFRRIKVMMGTELLQIDRAALEEDTFVFTAEHYDAYLPDQVTMNIEALDGPGNMFSIPTEVDLRPLLDGIPANLILPNLKQYPIGPIPGATGLAGEDTIDQQTATEQTGGVGGGGGKAIGPAVV
jgi:hypothetical protein